MTAKILYSQWLFRLVTIPFLLAVTPGVVFSERLFRAHVFDLRAVVVAENGACDAPPCVIADRVIQRDGVELVWWVSVHLADTRGKDHITPRTFPAPYSRDAYLAEPILHRTLAWWMGGQSRLDDAALVQGVRYFIRTCHAVPPLNWPRACTESNTFTIAN